MTLQIAGLAMGATTHVRRELRDGALVLFHLATDGRLLAASGIGMGNAVAKDIRLAEMLIARGQHPDPAALADPAIDLKRLLSSRVQASTQETRFATPFENRSCKPPQGS